MRLVPNPRATPTVRLPGVIPSRIAAALGDLRIKDQSKQLTRTFAPDVHNGPDKLRERDEHEADRLDDATEQERKGDVGVED